MGRQKEFRQLTKQHTDSIAAKTSLHGLIQLVKTHCEISLPEADILGRVLYHFYVDNSERRNEGQIIFPAKWNPERCGRSSEPLQEPLMVNLTIFHPHDVELWREAGIRAYQQARIARLVGEAYAQGAVLSLTEIGVLTITAAKTIREALKTLWSQGVCLPIVGMARKYAEMMKHSLAQVALLRYLRGDALEVICAELYLCTSAWLAIRNEAQRQIQEQQGELFEIWANSPPSPLKESLMMGQQNLANASPQDRESLYGQLTSYFGMSRAGADLLLDKVEHWLGVRSETRRADGQVVYYAVADDEPAGKALHECNLVPVVLDYLTPEDQEGFDKDAPKPLFSLRLQRIARQAYEQGGVLNHSDLAFILGVGQDAIKAFMKNSEEFVPTRGNVIDIGPGLTHAKKIIQLFMEGYSETEIVRRTRHTYASVENYLDRFCKVIGLRDDGLTAVEIRIALGCSLNTVKDYLELAKEFDTQEYRWTMAQIRNRYAQKKTERTQKRR